MFENLDAKQVLVMDETTLLRALEHMYIKIVADKKIEPEWISASEAKTLMGIKSSTTLISYKNQGLIRYSTLSNKRILYSRSSIMEFISSRAKETF